MDRDTTIKPDAIVMHPVLLLFLFYDMLATKVFRCPVTVGQIVYPNAFAGTGMDELTITKIDTAMRSAGGIGGKEDQIARDELLAALGAQTKLILFVSGTRDRNAILGKDVLEIAGTVKGFGSCPSEFVRNSDAGFGCLQQRADFAACKNWGIIGGKCVEADSRRGR